MKVGLKMVKPAKLDDVAKLAGVSKNTASRVLNHRGYLSQKTIDKVHAAMAELNYRPNVIARQLYRQQTGLVGLVFPTVNNPFFAELEAALEKSLYNHGFRAVMGNSENDAQKEEQYLQLLLDHQIDGLIVGSHNTNIQGYHTTNLPIVSIERIVSNQIPVVASDNYQGGLLATQHLLDAGCRSIVHTNYPQTFTSPNYDRQAAYEEQMRKHGLTPITYSIPFDEPENTKLQKIRQIFIDHPEIDGLFADNDTNARLAITAAAAFGKNCPKDLKVIGYDGAAITRLLFPELTTIQQPISEMAITAVNLLIQKINGEPVTSKTLPVKLIAGTTT